MKRFFIFIVVLFAINKCAGQEEDTTSDSYILSQIRYWLDHARTFDMSYDYNIKNYDKAELEGNVHNMIFYFKMAREDNERVTHCIWVSKYYLDRWVFKRWKY